MEATSPSDRNETCACTGVRWCARCLDPGLRKQRKMDDPVPTLAMLESRPSIGLDTRGATSHIHLFDPALQSAPTLAEFEGVRVIRDFVSPSEADDVLTRIEASPFRPAQSGKGKQHYGPKINFNKRRVNPASFGGLPDYAREIETRARRILTEDRNLDGERRGAIARALGAFETTDVFVLRYRPTERSNLDFHLDDVFAYGELILDLSLESDAWLTFLKGRPDSEVTGSDALVDTPLCVRVPMPARSLVVLYGPARFEWEHAVLDYDIEARRTSITLRTLSPSLRDTEAGRTVLERARGANA